MKKRRIEIAVISDVHLGSYQCHAEELLAYLSSIRPKKLILNGDIIDGGRTVQSYFPEAHFKVLKKIFSMAAGGTEVYYLCGNHDAMLRKFSGYRLRTFHVRNKLQLNLDGKQAWIFHGDAFDLMPGAGKRLARIGTSGYGFLLGMTRGVNWIRVKLGKEPISQASRLRKNPEKSARIIRRFQKTISDLAILNGFDYIICGHLHIAAKEWMETPAGKTLYLNSGDWVENLTALEYNFKRWKLYRYDEDKLSPFFADEDLKEMDINDLIASIVARKEVREERQKEKPSGE
ncbi:MAG: UDP-2,3-diacylglucosamine diphosphatase [Robiginitalea sp.]